MEIPDKKRTEEIENKPKLEKMVEEPTGEIGIRPNLEKMVEEPTGEIIAGEERTIDQF